MKLNVYDATDRAELDRATADIEGALQSIMQVTTDIVEAPAPNITANTDLIGLPDSIYAEINAALKSGKRHLMFYGPPGTGKTQLAMHVASQLSNEYMLVTGSSDWTSQDLIGGYMPTGSNKISFLPGLLLQNFDKPFVIDELNRCDIDKVLGPLFTVLSGAPSTLPYLTNPEDSGSPRYSILAEYNPRTESHEFSPTPFWRLFATINSIDKASLYQMSYALMRRFAWILVDVPDDLAGFIREYCTRKSMGAPGNEAPTPLADAWRAVNAARRIGPAPFIDLLRFCRAWQPDFDFFKVPDQDAQRCYIAGLSSFVFPMLDGITRTQGDAVLAGVAEALSLSLQSNVFSDLKLRVDEVSI